MDFLEDLEMYNKAMENAYLIITKRTTLDDIYYEFEQDRELKEFFYLLILFKKTEDPLI